MQTNMKYYARRILFVIGLLTAICQVKGQSDFFVDTHDWIYVKFIDSNSCHVQFWGDKRSSTYCVFEDTLRKKSTNFYYSSKIKLTRKHGNWFISDNNKGHYLIWPVQLVAGDSTQYNHWLDLNSSRSLFVKGSTLVRNLYDKKKISRKLRKEIRGKLGIFSNSLQIEELQEVVDGLEQMYESFITM